MPQEAESNEQLLINYLRRDVEHWRNRAIIGEELAAIEGAKRERMKKKILEIAGYAEQKDIEEGLQELIREG